MSPPAKKMLLWIGSPRAMATANAMRTELALRALPRWRSRCQLRLSWCRKLPLQKFWVGGSHLDERTGHARDVASTSATARSGTGTNRQRKLRRRSSSGSGLMAASLVRKRAHCGQRGPRCSLVATGLLDECEGLSSPCGRLLTTSVVILRRQHRLMTTLVVVLRRQHHLMTTSVIVLRRQHHSRQRLATAIVGCVR